MREVKEEQALEAVRTLLSYIGDDPDREGLKETPSRVLRAWKETWGKGYAPELMPKMKMFKDGSEDYDEIIVVKNISVFSHCEHHMTPFFGLAHVGYLPNEKVVGISKLVRMVDYISSRLQVQERITVQVVETIEEELSPRGSVVILECRHMCMESRGVKKVGASTVTSAVRGEFKENLALREEAFRLLRSE